MLHKLKLELTKILKKETSLSDEQIFATFEPSPFADLTTKISFLVAKTKNQNPVEVAKNLATKLNHKYLEKAEAKGPYINFFLNNKLYIGSIKKMLKEKEKYGRSKQTNKNYMVEYFHANTHKGVHVGHIRNISLGESLCKILEFAGNKVIRVNFQGDIGPHVAKCLWGFINLHHQKEPKTHKGTWLGKVYAEASMQIKDHPELEEQVQDINLRLYSKDKEMTKIWERTRQWCLDDFEEFYKEFGVKFDELYFESQSETIGKKMVYELLEKGVVKKDNGAIIIDLKDDGLGVFVLLTKEGYPLYSTKDLGLAKLKFDKYKIDKSIHVVGREQELHFKQLFKLFEKMGFEKAAKTSYHLIYGLVMLPEGKMSSREGTMILYQDLNEKLLETSNEEVKKRHKDWEEKEMKKVANTIAMGALKFSMIRREPNRELVFDWNEALKLEGDTGPYIQYAVVRALGILRKAKEMKEKPKLSVGHSFNSQEKDLVNKLNQFHDIVQKSSRDLAPHLVANYLLEIANLFNRFYDASPVLNADSTDVLRTRLALVQATNYVIKTGLSLLGIGCPERM